MYDGETIIIILTHRLHSLLKLTIARMLRSSVQDRTCPLNFLVFHVNVFSSAVMLLAGMTDKAFFPSSMGRELWINMWSPTMNHLQFGQHERLGMDSVIHSPLRFFASWSVLLFRSSLAHANSFHFSWQGLVFVPFAQRVPCRNDLANPVYGDLTRRSVVMVRTSV